MKKPLILAGTFVIAFALGALYTSYKTGASHPVPNGDGTGITTYECLADKSIWAAYMGTSSVNLSLSDGSSVTLGAATSASGARYANTDESFVFWNKGKTAVIQENGEITYEDCREK